MSGTPPGGRRGPRRDAGPRPLSESLAQAVARLGDAGPAQLSAIFSRWDEVAGPVLGRHVRPLRISGGVLVVAVDHPAWATEVRAMAASLLERVGEIAGEVPDRLEVTVRRPGGGSQKARNQPPVG
ncbi:MAG: DUF721 domain-containing protein [Acidimicrobiales bacterium]